MSLKTLGQNTTEEFFETLIYMAAYNEAVEMIRGFTGDIENPYLREAVESAANVAVFGGIFMIIQYEEKIIEKVFNLVSGSISILMSLPKKSLLKLKNLRGRKFTILSQVLGNISDNGIQKSQIIVSQLNNFIQGRNNQYQSMNLVDSAQEIRKSVYQRENMRMELASKMAQRYNETLIFKLLTSSFSEQDITILKKILGTYNPEAIDIDDLNKISSFMFVKDDSGKVIGLSESFLELVNGLGYINK
ncbi:MAG: hypothetical protein GXO49_01370 [Chlorobi bacterium]|nr:hypothetical protein [Chlorobiota bacterium]